MPAQTCPRCHRANPELAQFCYHDGAELRGSHDGSAFRLAREFVFPSGRRCLTYDEFAQACQEEWAEARGLLQRGLFAQFFASCGRADLVRAAEDANVQDNDDIALTTFLAALPGVRTQTPKLDISPRRFLLGHLLAGETRELQLTVMNTGQGTLQGAATVSEGQAWVSLDATRPVHETALNAPRQQVLTLYLKADGQAAGQSHAAKLTVVTNGGVVEVPLRMDLVARPFPKPPFQGARTQRELAERMRARPKDGVPLLESGEVRRWFALNGWTYPVQGPEVKGVAAVQQFFEALGLSKPPKVQVSQPEVRLRCRYPESTRVQVTLSTNAKKWVYAEVRSDRPWLKVPAGSVSGPQQANLTLEVDASLMTSGGPNAEGKVTIVANGGQTLTVRVLAEVQGLPTAKPVEPVPDAYAARPRAGTPGLLMALLALPLLFLLARLLLVPVVDGGLRSAVVQSAAARLGAEPTPDSPVMQVGGWLLLPWPVILAGGAEGTVPAELFQPGNTQPLSAAEFRHYFASYFLRALVLWTWWLGGVLGAVLLWRRGGATDALWGLVAGAAAGLAGSATLGSLFLVVETLPHALWRLLFGDSGGGFFWWAVWVVLAVLCWAAVGLVVGQLVSLVPPLRRVVLDPLGRVLARLSQAAGSVGPID